MKTNHESEAGTVFANVTTKDEALRGTNNEAQPTAGKAQIVKLPRVDSDGMSDVIAFCAIGSAGAKTGTLIVDVRHGPSTLEHTVPDAIVRLYEPPY